MKKIAAIHDLSGYGRASPDSRHPHSFLYGVSGLPLPHGYFIRHSEYKDFRSFDLTDQMQGIIDHWKELDLHFDALYSGYLHRKNNEYRIGFFDDFSQDDNFILVDPVLGDHGNSIRGWIPA